MPGENLTRIEAQQRAAVVTSESYVVHLDLTNSDTTFRSTTTIEFGATPGSSTFLDAITDTVHSVTLNGATLDHNEMQGLLKKFEDRVSDLADKKGKEIQEN